jgi:hypothetical protein
MSRPQHPRSSSNPEWIAPAHTGNVVQRLLSSARIWTCLTIAACLATLLAACSTPTNQPPFPPASGSQYPTIAETLVVTTATPTASAPSLRLLQTPTPSQPDDAARAAIVDAILKFQSAGPFRVTTTINTQGGGSTKATAEVILPDRFRIITPDTEILIVGDLSFTRQDGAWVKETSSGLASLIPELIGNLSNQAIQGISAATLVHPETLNEIHTQEYRYQSDIDLAGETIFTDNQLWIDDATGLPVRLVSAGFYNGVQSTTIQEFTYDPAIAIDVPPP